METNLGTIKLRCSNCGSEQFIQKAATQTEQDDFPSPINCANCGIGIDRDQLNSQARQVAETAADAIADALRKALK